MKCPLCSSAAQLFRTIDGIGYFDCQPCDFIFADPGFLELNDAGGASREYTEEYWRTELSAAKERSYGPGPVRFAEAALYCRVPIRRTIDIGTGPGYLLASLSYQLPSSAHKFFGVEAFPPPESERAKLKHPENYVIGFAGDLQGKFELGTCIEVIEHLTPKMANDLAQQMSSISAPGSLFIFNTGLTDFVRKIDPHYLDPLRRGHITSWSIRSIEKIFAPAGFKVHEIEGKSYAFALEFMGSSQPLAERIWTPVPENKAMLESDPETGGLLYCAGLDAARASVSEKRLHQLQAALDTARATGPSGVA